MSDYEAEQARKKLLETYAEANLNTRLRLIELDNETLEEGIKNCQKTIMLLNITVILNSIAMIIMNLKASGIL